MSSNQVDQEEDPASSGSEVIRIESDDGDCPGCKTAMPDEMTLPDGSTTPVQFCPVCGGCL